MDNVLDKPVYNGLTIRALKDICGTHEFSSTSELARSLGFDAKQFTCAMNKQWAKGIVSTFLPKGGNNARATVIQCTCVCCGVGFGVHVDAAFDPEDFDTRRLCQTCKTSDQITPYKVYEGIKLVTLQIGSNSECRTLQGEEFERAAAECTPILDIKNKAGKNQFGNLGREIY